MVNLVASVGRVLAALFLVALNGFFVASEFAFVRVRSTAVDQLVEEGQAGAATLQEALGKLDDYLAATQLGITVASLGLGWIGEPAVAALIEPLLGTVLPPGTTHLVAVAVGFSVPRSGSMSAATAGSPIHPRPREATVIPSWVAAR